MGVGKVTYYGKILIDLTVTNVTAETLIKGATALNAKGEIIEGTAPTEEEVIASLPIWNGGSY